MSALLSVKLATNIARATSNTPIKTIFWTDAKVVLAWLKRNRHGWKLFVQNRVDSILKITHPDDWHHCPGTENPADLASRGASVAQLRFALWMEGPAWLQLPPHLWPPNDSGWLDLETVQDEKAKNQTTVPDHLRDPKYAHNSRPW